MRTDQIKAALMCAFKAVESLEAKGCQVVQVSIGNFHPVIELADMPELVADKTLEPIQVKAQGQLITLQTMFHKNCLVTWPAQLSKAEQITHGSAGMLSQSVGGM